MTTQDDVYETKGNIKRPGPHDDAESAALARREDAKRAREHTLHEDHIKQIQDYNPDIDRETSERLITAFKPLYAVMQELGMTDGWGGAETRRTSAEAIAFIRFSSNAPQGDEPRDTADQLLERIRARRQT